MRRVLSLGLCDSATSWLFSFVGEMEHPDGSLDVSETAGNRSSAGVGRDGEERPEAAVLHGVVEACGGGEHEGSLTAPSPVGSSSLTERESTTPQGKALRVPMWQSKLMLIMLAASRRSWKPVTLQAPLLLSLVFASLCVIGLLEHLSRQSQKNRALVFVRLDGGFPGGLLFAYLYLPTIVAVCYGVLWGWVDLDTKRLEPFFQLSKPGGVRAEDSILLHYPFDFLPLAPIRAARRK